MPEFSLYLEVKKGNYISLYVYNSARDTVRQVSVLLTEKAWGQGQRGLGCTVATGFLHKLPNRDSNGINGAFGVFFFGMTFVITVILSQPLMVLRVAILTA